MKTKLIVAAFLACLTGNASAETTDAVVPTIHGNASGTSWVMNIGLQNASDYVAFQMDITLPEGISAGTDDTNIVLYDRLKGIDASATLDESTQFVVSKNLIDESTNTYRIIGYNLGNTAVKEGTTYNDAMFKVNLTSSKTINLSDIAATVSNAIFVKKTGTDLAGVNLVAADANLDFTTGLLGDANVDNVVDTEDKIAVIQYFLGNSVDNSFSGKNADANNDGVIDTEDGIKIINTFLNN